MKKLFLIGCAALALAACSKDDDPTLNVTPLTVEFDAEGGSSSFNIETNQNWTLNTDGADWYTVTPASGSGNTVVAVTVNPYTDAAERTAQLSFSAKNLVRTVAIVQHRPAVPSDPSALSYNINVFEQDLTVAAPEGFTYKIVLPETGGISVKSNDEKNIVLHFTLNDSGAERTWKVDVTTTDDKPLETITVRQSTRSMEKGDLVFEEIFFAGCAMSAGNYDSGDGDQYFKITNVTDHTVYADGLLVAISETSSQTASTGATWKYPELPDSIGVKSVYVIPGKGQDVAVNAGESLVLALSAIDFESENGYGIDLSRADFEFYDENDRYPDTDNPMVPDLLNWVKGSATLTTLHNRGYESYAIAMPPYGMTSEIFLRDYKWTGKRVMDWNGFHFEREISDAYRIPNGWVIDGVNCGVPENFGTLAFNASVDAGYTGVSQVDGDDTRFGKSVLRKRDASGKIIDTDNSTNDFEISNPATLK